MNARISRTTCPATSATAPCTRSRESAPSRRPRRLPFHSLSCGQGKNPAFSAPRSPLRRRSSSAFICSSDMVFPAVFTIQSYRYRPVIASRPAPRPIHKHGFVPRWQARPNGVIVSLVIVSRYYCLLGGQAGQPRTQMTSCFANRKHQPTRVRTARLALAGLALSIALLVSGRSCRRHQRSERSARRHRTA